MSWIRILKVNIFITFALLISIEASLTLAFYFRDQFFTNSDAGLNSLPPNVTSETMGFRNEEKNFMGYPYKAFLGWVSPEIEGDFINVTHGRRITYGATVLKGDETIHLFGGSTMWGHSVSDKNTIPSFVSKNLRRQAINYGEQAYNSRQELNLLLDSLDIIKEEDVVIFYDGVNDIYYNCRSYNSPNGHAREFYIREILSGNANTLNFSFVESFSTFRFLRGMTNRLGLVSKSKNSSNDYFNACANNTYADKVANFLIKNWESAEAILTPKGVKFMCILQPNPYTLKGSSAYFNEEMRSQIESVYPIIREKAKNLSCFNDYSSVLTEDNYVDHCCHLNELGNSKVSAQLSTDIKRRFGF